MAGTKELRAMPNKLDAISKGTGYRSAERYERRCEFLFDGIDLKGKRVIDIGCGKGPLALWAAVHGASYVLAMEPESDGSSAGSLNQLRRLVKELDLENVVFPSAAFYEEFPPDEAQFDVAVMFNVINHIDEGSVQSLHNSSTARLRYIEKLQKLRKLMVSGGVLLIADCARNNLWGDLRLKNPFAPTIEWKKHQNPGVWRGVLEESGFSFLNLTWSQLYPLGNISQSRLLHYATVAHFLLKVRAT